MVKYAPNSRGICPHCRTTVNFECPDFKHSHPYNGLSPKASAAISRRCLQTVLGEAGGIKAKDLSKQIDEVLSKLPSHIAESIDAVRNIGNFAAHPQKSQSSGTILDVEPGEAEWTLDVLDTLFDFYYVQPQKLQQKRAALNLNLKEAGKPPMN